MEIGRRRLALFLVLVFLTSLFLTMAGRSAAQKKARAQPSPTPQPQAHPTSVPSPTPELVIPLPQVAARAEELRRQLQEMDARLTLDSTLNSIDQTLKAQEFALSEQQQELDELIAIIPTHAELIYLEQKRLKQKELYAASTKTLTERSKSLEEDARFLEQRQKEWRTLLHQVLERDAIEMVVELIRNALEGIQKARTKADELLKALLADQEKVSQQNQKTLEALRRISQEKARLQRSLFKPDSPPLWRAASQSPSDHRLDHRIEFLFKRNLARTKQFIGARRYPSVGVILLFLILLPIMFAVRGRVPHWVEKRAEIANLIQPFSRPCSLALLIVLTVILPATPGAPAQIRTLVIALFLGPVIRLLAPLIKPTFRSLLYGLVVFGIAMGAWEVLVSSPALKRWGFFTLSVTLIVVFVWLAHRARSRLPSLDRKSRLVILVIRSSLGLILISIAANVFGYVGLSRLLRSGTILSAYAAIVLHAVYLVAANFQLALFKTRKISSLSSAGLRGEIVIRWTRRLMRLTVVFLWTSITLNLFLIRQPVLSAASYALTTPIKLKVVSFTFGDVLTVVLALVIGVALAGVIRTVLREWALTRLNLKQGIPFAISTIAYYFLLVMVFILALSLAGMDLSKLTILTGAFGVGIGFGLQNVISNFASGIILLFERPIRIGDFLEIGNSSGEVVRMGMRSSSMMTPQGAEVIVPNSNLLSNQVVNWTLTGKMRRIELLIRAAYDTDPELLSQLLLEGADSHPKVMRDPKASVCFLGFGDNSLDFELRFWTPELSLYQEVKNEVAYKILLSFRERGIKMSSPRRELYLKSVDDSTAP
jgi:potassium efflux system protein